MEKYARRCDITGKGMNEGWCWGDGAYYTKTEKDTIKELRIYNFDGLDSHVISGMSDDELMQYAYDDEVLYWSQWYKEDIEGQGYYYTANGEEIEI